MVKLVKGDHVQECAEWDDLSSDGLTTWSESLNEIRHTDRICSETRFYPFSANCFTTKCDQGQHTALGNGVVALTGIVLIHDAVAIGNAFEVSKITRSTIRNTTIAQFHSNSIAWYCDVTNYTLHPDFNRITVNTVALVFLEARKKTYQWQPIQWAKKEKKKFHSVFNIGYSDSNRKLEQVLYNLAYVTMADCVQFYQNEELDFKIIWPAHYRCYKNKHAQSSCVFDAGMALATNYTGTWELLGIGIRGPGCSLPSRYIDIIPYVPWIQSKLQKDTRRMRRKGKNSTTDPMYSVSYKDYDTYYLGKINDTSMVLRPWAQEIEEKVFGACNSSDGTIAYRDFNSFDLPSPAIGIYVVSHLDTLFQKYNCIMMTVHNSKKSETKFWFDKGFHQEDIDQFTKKVPIKNARGEYPPRILYVEDSWKKYEVFKTAHLMFRFQMEDKAWFDVKFYGDLANVTSVRKSSFPRVPKMTRRRRYPTRLRASRYRIG